MNASIHSFTPFISRARSVSAIEHAFLPGSDVLHCDMCDGIRKTEVAYCVSCGDFTGSYVCHAEEDDDAISDLADYLYDEPRSDDLLREMGA
jgi:DNA polymerase II small subunit/DNA polymerase delta subunit B